MLATLFFRDNNEQMKRGGTDELEGLFEPVSGPGYVYQVIRVDSEWMYALSAVQTFDGTILILMKTNPEKQTETIFVCPENNTIH